MRVFFVPILRFTRILCLDAISSGPRVDDTRFRATNKQRLEIMIVVVSNVRVDVGMA